MDTLTGLPVVDTAVGRARLGLPSRQKTREELLKEVLVPISCGADFSANCLLQFGYFNNAVARKSAVNFAKYDVERAEYRRDVSEHVSASQEIHCRQVWE